MRVKQAACVAALFAVWQLEMAVYRVAKRLGTVKPEPRDWEGKVKTEVELLRERNATLHAEVRLKGIP